MTNITQVVEAAKLYKSAHEASQPLVSKWEVQFQKMLENAFEALGREAMGNPQFDKEDFHNLANSLAHNLAENMRTAEDIFDELADYPLWSLSALDEILNIAELGYQEATALVDIINTEKPDSVVKIFRRLDSAGVIETLHSGRVIDAVHCVFVCEQDPMEYLGMYEKDYGGDELDLLKSMTRIITEECA